ARPGRDAEEWLRRAELRRVVQFRARKNVVLHSCWAHSCCDEHSAVGKQRCNVQVASEDEAAGRTPGSARRIVQLRARKDGLEGALTACAEHLAVGEQCRRVTKPRGSQATSRTPGSARRIVQFRAGMN